LYCVYCRVGLEHFALKSLHQCIMGIQNIVFDLGGVLVTWDPLLLVDRVFQALPKDSRPYEVAKITHHQTWKDLDRGVVSFDDAEKIFVQLAVDKVIDASEQDVKTYLRGMVEYIIQLPPGIKILQKVRELGYRTYVLSNYNLEFFQYITKRFDWFEGFDGLTVSYDVHFNKPDPAIYEKLLEMHSLVPEETIFIDDKIDNIEAARAKGITGIVCDNHQNVFQQLKSLGVFDRKSSPIGNPVSINFTMPGFTTGEFVSHRKWLADEEYGVCLDNMVKACVDVFLIHAETDRVLLAKRNYHPQKDWWVSCGGRMFPGETPRSTLARLFQREISMDLASLDFESKSEPDYIAGIDCKGIVSVDYVDCYTHIWGKRRQAPEDNGTCDVVIVFAVVASEEFFQSLVLDKEEYSDSKFVRLIDLVEDDKNKFFHPALSKIAQDIRKMRSMKRLCSFSRRALTRHNEAFLAKQAILFVNNVLH
jgi:putative hydrolase of the HAD superfamily